VNGKKFYEHILNKNNCGGINTAARYTLHASRKYKYSCKLQALRCTLETKDIKLNAKSQLQPPPVAPREACSVKPCPLAMYLLLLQACWLAFAKLRRSKAIRKAFMALTGQQVKISRPVKYLIIFISVLLVNTVPAAAHHPFCPYPVAADTAVMPDYPEFLEDIVAGDDNEDEADQDGNSKKKGSSKANKSTSATTGKSKRVASPSQKLAALTPDEENLITDLPRKNRKAIGIELSAPLQFKYAILLDVPVEMINDNKLLELIESWYGTKYRFGGDSRQGVDCSGFTRAFMGAYYDVELSRRSEDQYLQCTRIKKKKLRQGDLVFFKTRGAKGGISHVGVYLCNNKFVHAATSSGVMISDLDEDYYKTRFVGGGRIK
jgi:cell wall-associated NlpC family hydrolase